MALPRTRREPQRVLTASAVKMDPANEAGSRRRAQSWQKRALEYVDLIPEFNYASRFYSRMMSRIRIYPAFRTSDDKSEAITEGLPVDILDRIQDPGGGRSQIQSQYGRLMLITGEGNLFGRNLGTDEERWSFVWNEEIEVAEDGTLVWKPTAASAGVTYGPSEGVSYRMWRPHPARSGEAESPMHGVLEVAEELYILTKAVRATAVSRMVNGLLKVPTELSFGAAEAGHDEDPEANPFLEDLIEHITGVVENAGSAEAAAPFLAEAAAEFLDGLEWISLHDAQTDYMERELRKEAIQRAAYGLDMPPEVLLGLADANHWTGRQITHDMWRSHGAPVAEQFCDDLSEVYLRPALRDAGFARWREVVVAYDDADVVISPDRSDDADRAFDRMALSWDGYRKLKGIPDALAPDEEEKKILLALRLRAPELLAEIGIVPGERGPIRSSDNGRPAEEGPEDPGPSGVTRRERQMASEKILGAAELAIIRCREIAGARVRTRQKSNPEFLAIADGQPNAAVVALLGQQGLQQLEAPDPLQLVQGGTESFCSLLIEWGLSEGQSQSLSEMLLVFAAKTLFDRIPPPLPSGFIAQVARAQEVSDVLGPSDREVVRQNDESLMRLNSMLMGVKK